MSKLLEAITYGAKAMRGMTRKNNGRDYFTDHCMRLLAMVALDPLYGKEEETAIIIVLHDVVEDCAGPTDDERAVGYADLLGMFGEHVEHGVWELTNEYTSARYPNVNRANRKTRELTRLKQLSHRGQTLKLYDRIVNLDDLIVDEDFNTTYARESQDLARALFFGNAALATVVRQQAARLLAKRAYSVITRGDTDGKHC